MTKITTLKDMKVYSVKELEIIKARVDGLIDRLIPFDVWVKMAPRKVHEIEYARWIHKAANEQRVKILSEIKRLSTH